jgi:hypothetical protein
MLFVQATLQAAWDWAAEKFWPMVEATPRLNPDAAARSRRSACPTATARQEEDQVRALERLCAARRRQFGGGPAPAHGALCDRGRSRPVARRSRRAGQPGRDGQPAPQGVAPAGLSKRLKISTPTIEGREQDRGGLRGERPPALPSEVPGCGDAVRCRVGGHSLARRQARGSAPGGAVLRVDRRALAERRHEAARRVAVGRDRRREKAAAAHDEEAFQAWRARMPASRKRGFT